MAISEAKKRANQKWNSKHKVRKQYLDRRSIAKNFILHLATKNDLIQLKEYIVERQETLNKGNNENKDNSRKE